MNGEYGAHKRRGFQAWITLLVSMLVLVPTLVRATQALDPGATPPSIRLNRGFDAPESKCRITPPSAPLAVPPAFEWSAPAKVEFAFFADAPLPQAQRDVSPQVLRGPPVSPSHS
jgi:hypothetical protein